MIVIFILTISIVLQFVAAIMAFRLIPLTGRRVAWSLISAALMLMALRRCITLIHSLSGEMIIRPDLNAEIIALAISLMMAVGISRIAPIFIDRKLAEEAVKESEARYRSLFENNHAVTLLIDPDNAAIIDANPAACAYYGWSREELMKRRIDEINTLTREAVSAEMQLARSEKRNHFFFKHRRADGTIRDVEVYSGPIQIKGRALLYSIIHDITERKRAEEALRESKELYRTFINATSDMVYLKDEQFRHIVANKWLTTFFGKPEGEIIGKDDFELMPQIAAEKCRQTDVEAKSNQSILTSEEIVGDQWYETLKFPIELGHNRVGVGGFIRDITIRKRAEEELLQQKNLLNTIIESTSEAIFAKDKTGKYHSINEAGARMLGYRATDVIGNTDMELLPTEIAREFRKTDEHVMSSGQVYQREEIGVIGDNTCIFLAHKAPWLDNSGKIIGVIGVSNDITARKHAEDVLKERELRFRHISEIMSDIAYSCSVKGNGDYSIDWITGAVEPITGYTTEELKDLGCWRSLVVEGDLLLFERHVIGLAPGASSECELRIRQKSGGICWLGSFAECIHESDQTSPSYLYGGLIDITKRKQTEEALTHSHGLMRFIIEHNRSAIAVHDRDLKYIYVSQRYLQDYGVKEKDVIGKHHYDVFPDLPQKWRDVHQKALAGEISSAEDDPYVREDGSVDWTRWECRPWNEADGSIGGIIIYTEVITERKQIEENLQKSENNFRRSLDDSPLGTRIVSSEGDTIYANRALLAIYGYESIEELQKISAKERYTTESYTEFLVRKEKRQKGNAAPSEYEISIVRKNGEIRHLRVFRKEIVWSGAMQFQVLYNDITKRKRAEDELQRTVENLRKAFSATVQVLVSAVETRDPYTAGHQIRSSDLAHAIATELGLPQDRIDGIRMASSIHDIGKMSIPAEILVKPTKLSELEFSLIKEHANKGFEMLKDVESPWPLAQIVYQHHERMDGSGYPRHLKGEEILMEARILSVADVVEAMASHRPYRPAIGLNAALAEIENNKGTIYDADAVDACLRLFREKGFQLELSRL